MLVVAVKEESILKLNSRTAQQHSHTIELQILLTTAVHIMLQVLPFDPFLGIFQVMALYWLSSIAGELLHCFLPYILVFLL